MTERVFCTPSVIVALLLDSGPDGTWATHVLSDTHLAAPTLAQLEAAGVVGPYQAARAHADLVALAIELWPHGCSSDERGSSDATPRSTTRAARPSPS